MIFASLYSNKKLLLFWKISVVKTLVFRSEGLQFNPPLGQTFFSFFSNFFVKWCILFDYRVYDIEERIKTPRKFRFPQFEPVNWLAAQKLKNDLSDLNSDSTLCPSHLLSGIKALLQALKLWLPDLETKVCSKLLLFIGIVYLDNLNWNFLRLTFENSFLFWEKHIWEFFKKDPSYSATR